MAELSVRGSGRDTRRAPVRSATPARAWTLAASNDVLQPRSADPLSRCEQSEGSVQEAGAGAIRDDLNGGGRWLLTTADTGSAETAYVALRTHWNGDVSRLARAMGYELPMSDPAGAGFSAAPSGPEK